MNESIDTLDQWTGIDVDKILITSQANIVWVEEKLEHWKAIKSEYKRDKETDKDILKDFLEGCSQHIQVLSNIKQSLQKTASNMASIKKALEDRANGIEPKIQYACANLQLGKWENGKKVEPSKAYYYDLYLSEADLKSGNYEIPTNGKWVEM